MEVSVSPLYLVLEVPCRRFPLVLLRYSSAPLTCLWFSPTLCSCSSVASSDLTQKKPGFYWTLLLHPASPWLCKDRLVLYSYSKYRAWAS